MTLAYFEEHDRKGASPWDYDVAREIERHSVQQAAVANLGQAALSGASMDSLFYLACAFVIDILGVDHCNILESYEARAVPRAAYALDTEAPVVVEDFAAEKRFVPTPAIARQGIVSGVTVPIMTGHRGDGGVLDAFSKTRMQFSTSDVDFLRALAGILGQAIVRSQADHELRMRAKQQSAISELTRLAMRSVNDATIARTRTILIECLNVHEAAFTHLDDEAPASAFAEVASPDASYGKLTVQAAVDRRFTAAELDFLQALAHILAEALDRERAARDLAASEQRYREVVEGASEVIFELSMD